MGETTGTQFQEYRFGSTHGTEYTVALLAGGTPLASTTGTGPEGSFDAFELTFDSTGSGLVRRLLEIRLSSNHAQSAFDHLALTGTDLTTVPEPSAIGLCAVMVWCIARPRRRKLARSAV
ncbi:MAG: hypothetical protein ACKV0T_06395 [Planctomycetales bacterium]